VHALGISFNGQGILLLLPSGGGKSTTALRLLRTPGVRLLAEDTPLIDRQGNMLPFPLRLGVCPGQELGIDRKYLRTTRRMEFDPKTLIDLEAFGDKIGQQVSPRILLIGERNLGEISDIVPLSKRAALRSLVNHMVVGLGVYQGLEFMLQRGPWELAGKLGVVASRLRNSLALLSNVQAYRFILGRDVEKNCRTLMAFLERS
jgi:hypothetical protein